MRAVPGSLLLVAAGLVLAAPAAGQDANPGGGTPAASPAEPTASPSSPARPGAGDGELPAGEGEAWKALDPAYGAYQRGFFLTAFALALTQARAGDATAQTLLGEILTRGLGVEQDLEEAAGWYRLAAEQGERSAQYELARMLLEGTGVERDVRRAAELFRAAGKKGVPGAWRELGIMTLEGVATDDGEPNPQLGAAYLTRAARNGDAEAQYALGQLYAAGRGVAQSEEQAARWLGEAARNGHVAAQVEYALMLFRGEGTTKDEAVAALWLRQAALSDNPVAQMRYARLLSQGRGVKRDPLEAARWYFIARSKGLGDEYMDDWITTLDAKQVDEARARAARWPGTLFVPPPQG